MSDNSSRVFTPPNLLRAKLGNNPGPSIDQIIAKAESAIRELREDFEVWIRSDLRSLRDAVATLRHEMDPTILEHIKNMSHDIKGQDATYGYPLLTTAGHMLWLFVDRNADVAGRNLDLIDAHVDFMALILKQKIGDQGNLQVQSILASLLDAAITAHGDKSQPATATASAT